MTGSEPPVLVVPVPPDQVVGGAAGLAAQYAEARALATAYDLAGNRMRDQAGLGTQVLADGDLVASALLSPLSFGEAEAAVLAATLGPRGILPASLGWEADAVLVRVAVESFQATDDLVRSTFEAVDYAAGRLAGFALGVATVGAVVTAPVWLPPVAIRGAGALALLAVLPPGLQARVREAGGEVGGALADDLETWVIDHPELVQHLVNGGGGVVDGFWDGLTPGVTNGPATLPTFTPTTEDAAGVLAGLFPPEGEPEVTRRADLAGASRPPSVPGSLAELMARLDHVNSWSSAELPENNGTIEIQSWTSEDGGTRHIVYLPGTDDMSTLPWTSDRDVRDMTTNFLAVNGQSTAYAEGVLEAMRRAGIAATDPVLLAGHSQGGIEAAWIASHTDDFNVTQVVTAGSPVAATGGYPASVQVLSLEHRGDVMPLLDGEDNPDAANHVTVTFDDHEARLGANHAIPHYVAGAAGVDASPHPSLVAALAGMRGDGFLAGETTEVTVQAFQITRRR